MGIKYPKAPYSDILLGHAVMLWLERASFITKYFTVNKMWMMETNLLTKASRIYILNSRSILIIQNQILCACIKKKLVFYSIVVKPEICIYIVVDFHCC